MTHSMPAASLMYPACFIPLARILESPENLVGLRALTSVKLNFTVGHNAWVHRAEQALFQSC